VHPVKQTLVPQKVFGAGHNDVRPSFVCEMLKNSSLSNICLAYITGTRKKTKLEKQKMNMISDREIYSGESKLPEFEEINVPQMAPPPQIEGPVLQSRASHLQKRMEKQNRNLWLTLCCFIPTCGFCCGTCLSK